MVLAVHLTMEIREEDFGGPMKSFLSSFVRHRVAVKVMLSYCSKIIELLTSRCPCKVILLKQISSKKYFSTKSFN